jgi:hypothetical protein
MSGSARPRRAASGVAAALVLALAAPAHAVEDGRTWAGDKTLRKGCRLYGYRYVVAEEHTEWVLETFLSNKHGVRVAHNALDGDVDPRRGRAFFGVCRPATVLGRHTIKAKLTSWTGGTSILDPKVEHVVWLEPSTFRMRRPR